MKIHHKLDYPEWGIMESQLKSAAHRLRRVRPTVSVGLSNRWSVDFMDGNGRGLVSLIPLVRDSRGGIERRDRRIGEHGSTATRGRRTGYGRRVLSFGN
jgi:hypothetical protein